MIVRKNFSIRSIWAFAGHHLIWLVVYMLLIVLAYEVAEWHWVAIPWLPVSLIGTAVAFYVGFKNNQSYDRVWEARKIWGAIVNSSRSWGTTVSAFVRNSGDTQYSEQEIKETKQRLIYRHIAWLYTLREQLLIPTQWEHINLRGQFGKIGALRRERYGIGLYKDFLSDSQKKSIFLMMLS